jgi:hypothetical protein
MPKVESYRGISVGDKIICIAINMASYGKVGIVKSISIEEGAINGWYEGDGFLCTGEEIKKYEDRGA